jgi:hypothetical protein
VSTFRVKKDRNNPYTMVHNGFIRDPNLSWKAKGIMLYLLSRPDDWVFHEQEVIRHACDGRDSFRAGVRELQKHLYIRKHQVKEEGKFARTEYEVFERPELFIDSVLVVAGFPSTENPSTVGSEERWALVSTRAEQ